ncbi:hypothetical protein MKX01_013490 [Papaver californicum]|nr:hypothetical protein MKX01_013490 [Papaver californicum]
MDECMDQLENFSVEDTSEGSKNPTEQQIFNWKGQYNRGSRNWEESIDLKISLEMLLQKATACADDWKDVNVKFDDRRTFRTFLWVLHSCGLDWHKYTMSLTSHPNLASDSNWVAANKYYDRSLSLMRILQRIQPIKHLKLIFSNISLFPRSPHQDTTGAAGCCVWFSEHLEQLRKSDAASLLAFSSNVVVDDDDDRYGDKSPFILFKHLFDSLYIMSRESTWLLRNFEASYYSIGPILAEESYKILEIIVLFISKFKKCKESLDEMMRMALENNGILDEFGRRIKDLQEQGIGRKSVSERLSGDSRDCHRVCRGNIGAHKRSNSELNSVMFTGGGSPLGNIAYWRFLFESSLVNHRLDLICKKYGETIKLGTYLNRLNGSVGLLLSAGDSLLLEFLAMHKTLSEITYMLGDAFTTGGAGRNDVSDETSPGTSNKDEKWDFDFPWDKHNVLGAKKFESNEHRTSFIYCPDNDLERTLNLFKCEQSLMSR